MQRRGFIVSLTAALLLKQSTRGTSINGNRLAAAARAQVGVTVGYDPSWTAIAYPGGDVPRATGVCADVIIRAARDGLGIDLQKLVHEDMVKHFDAYPARRTWGETRPDANVDHRRVLNLQAYFQRTGAEVWRSAGRVAGDDFPGPLEAGDTISWLLSSGQPHIGMVVAGPSRRTSNARVYSSEIRVVHNIGRGAEESDLAEFSSHRAVGHYRWPIA